MGQKEETLPEAHDQIDYLFEGPIPDERARLVRLCAAITGHPEAAEGLAQQTLLEAWCSRSRLVEPEGYSRWLSAVARNLCLCWLREQGGRSARESTEELEDEQAAAASPDLEIDLERRRSGATTRASAPCPSWRPASESESARRSGCASRAWPPRAPWRCCWTATATRCWMPARRSSFNREQPL